MKTFAHIVARNKILFVIVMSILWLFLTDEERDDLKARWKK